MSGCRGNGRSCPAVEMLTSCSFFSNHPARNILVCSGREFFSFQAGNTPVADALFPACFSKPLPFGGEYPFRGHGTPRRFFHPQPSRAGNELASRVPLPARDHACFSPPAGSTPAAEALLPAYPACFSVKGRGVSLLRMPCSPPVFQTTASPGGEMLPPRVPLPARNPQASLLSGSIASRAASTPIPQPDLLPPVGPIWLPGRLPPRFRTPQASLLSGSIASRTASHPESRLANFHFTPKNKKSPSR